MSEPRNVLTIATGKKLYLDMALNLARSFRWWNEGSDISFFIVTDQDIYLTAELAQFIIIKKIKPGALGEGFSTKLHLDALVPEGKTVFIDSDCLITGPIAPLFDAFEGHAVSVIGGYITGGEWFGDIKDICRNFNIERLPKFNGGVYYIEKGEIATAIYEKARQLEKQYDEIGFVRLRNKPNDEVLMSLSMELSGAAPISDEGNFLSDPQACQGGYMIDVIKGKCRLFNPPAPHPLHQHWYPFQTVSPLIFHFLDRYTLDYPYRREVNRLRLALTHKLNPVTEFAGRTRYQYPAQLKLWLKNTLRPLYHSIFGVRKINISERI